ncbi:AAA family ATPase [Streptomyces zingiberis]|uniref:AAA family ATPase n=1 Tax=Streptomyces zingiberis TaxID=2053010 RepID=UPI0023F9AA7D|nr:AAA family ATPase [Streptomyces zingiberis]
MRPTAEHPMELAGRTGLVQRLAHTLRDHGRAVLTGPAGAGRTALLDAVAATAEAHGETVLRLAPRERDRSVPGAAANALLDAIPTAALAPLPGMSLRAGAGLPAARAAGAAFPPARPAAPGAARSRRTTGTRRGAEPEAPSRTAGTRRGTGTGAGRARRATPAGLARAATVPALLRRLAGEWPVLLVIDDAQWLDQESLRLLRSVLHPYDGSVPPELRVLLAERTRAPTVSPPVLPSPAAPFPRSPSGTPRPYAAGSPYAGDSPYAGGAPSTAGSPLLPGRGSSPAPGPDASPPPGAGAPRRPRRAGTGRSSPVATVSRSLCGAGEGETVAVPPLSAADTAELLTGHGLPPRLAGPAHRASGGNPARALATARSLIAAPSPAPSPARHLARYLAAG